MPSVLLRYLVTRRPGWVVALWVASAVVVGLCAPDLTRLAAEGQGIFWVATPRASAPARHCDCVARPGL